MAQQPPPGGQPPDPGQYPPPQGYPPQQYPPQQQPGSGPPPGQQPYAQPPAQQPYGAPPGQYPAQAGYGAPAPAAGGYAEWWKRLVAAIIDGFVINIPAYIIMTVFSFGFAASTTVTIDPNTGVITGGSSSFFATFILAWLMIAIIGVAYYAYLHGTKGQTLGKMAMKIKVVDEANGEVIGISRAVVRALVPYGLYILFVIPALIDGLMPLWDPKKQSIHDKVAKSIVIDV